MITVDHGPNAAAQQAKPYVVMVSLDGFRYDYARKYGAKHLLALGAEGAIAAEGMIPAYPSLTFPNHYTLVTGLYPGTPRHCGQQLLRSGAQTELLQQRSADRSRRKLVWRHALVGAGGKTGHAQRLLLLARL